MNSGATLSINNTDVPLMRALLHANDTEASGHVQTDVLITLLNVGHIPFRLTSSTAMENVCISDNKVRRCHISCNRNETVCPVCLEPLQKGDAVVRLGCDHLLHARCGDASVKYNNSCPVCRARIGVAVR